MQFKRLNWSSIKWNKSIGLFGLMSLFLLTNCDEPEDVVGTEYVVAPSGIAIEEFQGVSDKIDFTTDSAAFSGKISHRATWYIDFKGLESGAEARIEGLSETIDPTTAFWDGSHDDLKFFREGETVEATLSFLKSDVTKTVTFVVDKTKKFEGTPLFEGFEKASYAWPYLMFSDYPSTTLESTDEFVVQGSRAFKMHGTDANGGYFIGGARTQYTDNNDNYYEFESFNADSVYFNCYIYGDGNTNTRVAIAVAEDDDLDGTYQDASNDVWEYPFKVTWTGWKLVSAKYSDFARSQEPLYGGSGNGKQELDKVKRITFNLLSDPAGNTAGYVIDYPVITYGGPFDPKK